MENKYKKPKLMKKNNKLKFLNKLIDKYTYGLRKNFFVFITAVWIFWKQRRRSGCLKFSWLML